MKKEILEEAIELVNEKLAISVNNSNELTKVLDLIFKEDPLEQHKNDLKKFISKKQNISNQILRDIL